MAGMSTSIVVKKMLNYAFEEDLDVNIKVFTLAEAISESEGYDLCLVAPQVAYELNKLQDNMKCKVMLIDKQDYGFIDGKSILDKAIAFYEKE
ncbi:PTS system, cellobiose-specific IIB component [Spiroplasma sp. TIUS-1]|nr:PTS system, cellobiose-specific IIB component [Spiroplasma sp. TIUS-1]